MTTDDTTEYEMIEIAKSESEKYGVDVREQAEFEMEDESEADHG